MNFSRIQTSAARLELRGGAFAWRFARRLARRASVWVGQRSQRFLSNPALLVLMAAVALGIPGSSVGVMAAEPQFTEQEVKAAFLHKIGLYTEWPANRFPAPRTPVVIGVLGRPDIAAQIEELAKKPEANIKTRRLEVRRLKMTDDLTQCHILFIGRENDYAAVLAKLTNTSVLTVAEHPDFARNGGMINFVLREGRIRFEVNPGVSNKARLKISSLLLDVVRGWGLIVNTEPEKGRR